MLTLTYSVFGHCKVVVRFVIKRELVKELSDEVDAEADHLLCIGLIFIYYVMVRA
jgi:hypothetical protein